MTFWGFAQRTISAAKDELRARGQLLAQAFAPSRSRARVDEPSNELSDAGDRQQEMEPRHPNEIHRQASEERVLRDRLNLATRTAGIAIWDKDMVRGDFVCDEQFWKIFDLPPDARFKVPEAIHADVRETVLAPLNDAFADPARDEILSVRHRTSNPRPEPQFVQTHMRVFRDADGKVIRLLGATWDVTAEEVHNEELQRQSQKERQLTERLSVATQSAGISTWEVDLVSGEFLWIENHIEAAATQSSDGSNKLDKFSERMHPEDKANFGNAIRAAAKSNHDLISYRYRYFHLDGTLAHIQSHAKLYFSAEHRAVRALGASWDISKEIEAAEKLHDAERRLERASLSSSEGHWETELATGSFWCSSSFHALLGYRVGELGPRIAALELLICPEDRQTYSDALTAHLSNNAPYDVELRLRMGSGEYRWFRMRGAAERNAEGSPTLIAGSIHDVHQQKLIEDALNLAQRRLERAINGTQDGLWELDVESGAAWCSPRLALLLGYPTAQLGTNNFLRSLIHHDDAAKLENTTLAHYRHNAPFDLEIRLKTRSGQYRWYRARATADRDAATRALRLSGSLQDVTEARAAREALMRATEAAEAANRAKSAFLANMSHEIRTPMNGIVGMTGLLLETELNRTQRDYADTIRGSADSLLTIVNDILDFSKIEAGKLDLEYIDVDLRLLVEDIASMMAFQAANKGLELIVNVHPETPERVKSDPQRLRQCLVNLISNAIKFTKKGEIAIDVCAMGRHEGRVLTHFEIRDTGIGIPQTTLKTLFQPFVQADSSTTRHFGGTGLGLSIVRRLVEMMGGQVGVVSELGEGSNFFFTLSLEPVDVESKATSPSGVHGGRILIVDDNATNRRVLRLQLEHQGYRIITAANGEDALAELHAAVAHDQPIDVTITDYQMPDMDGALLAARIAAEPAFANIRLIMLTSLNNQGDTQRLAALGFAAYLTKPIRRDELLTCVRRVLEGEARHWQMEIRPMITRSTLAQIEARKKFDGRVLLVEDNEINQKVARRVLERMGCTVHIVEHGAASIEAFMAEAFDLILMDLQMPVMDGITAARRIRELEAAAPDRKRTPIVALTANAMKGDRELCEAAGMDDYLTKPLEVERLRITLARFDMAVGESEQTVSAIKSPYDLLASSTPPIDFGQLNQLVDADHEFIRELLAAFLESGARQIAAIEAATFALDRPAIMRAAHKFKGGCANIHATALRTLASEMEASASAAEIGTLNDLCRQLRAEFVRVEVFLSNPQVLSPPIRTAS